MVGVVLEQRKQNRIFHRLATGLQIARNGNAYMRFMTLTTASTAKRDIRKSFQVLRQRIKRAKVEKDGFFGFNFNRYFCLRTEEGNGVLHVVYWGHFIPQAWLSSTWEKIHGAFRVDIRSCHTGRKTVKGLVGYLLTNYLTQQPIKRMSYGWRWAWLGFCNSWKNVKEQYGHMRRGKGALQSIIVHRAANAWNYTEKIYRGFRHSFSSRSVEAWQCILWLHPETSYQRKLTKYT